MTVRYPFDMAWIALATLVLVLVAWRLDALHWRELAIGGLLGLFSWSLVEYLTHRILLHHVPPLRQWHLEHHRAPNLEMTIPLPYFLAMLLAVTAIPPLAVAGDTWGFGTGLGLLCGFALLQWVHHWIHRQDSPRSSWLRKRREHHVDCHHRNPVRCFGTLTSLWDRLLGSL